MSRINHDNVAIIIPALNEEMAIKQTLQLIPQKFKNIIVVDNGSTDNTSLYAKTEGATVIQENRKGYGYACLAGITYLESQTITPKYVVFLDADGADNPENINRLVEAISKQPSPTMVMGSRMKNIKPGAMSAHAIIANKVLVVLIRMLYRTKISDMGPLRIIEFNALLNIKMKDTGYGWASEMIVKCLKRGYSIKEIDVEYFPRIGKSKISGSFIVSMKAAIWLTLHIFKNALR